MGDEQRSEATDAGPYRTPAQMAAEMPILRVISTRWIVGCVLFGLVAGFGAGVPIGVNHGPLRVERVEVPEPRCRDSLRVLDTCFGSWCQGIYECPNAEHVASFDSGRLMCKCRGDAARDGGAR